MFLELSAVYLPYSQLKVNSGGVSEPLLDGSLLTFTKHDPRKNKENASKLTAVYFISMYLYIFFNTVD